MAGGVVIGSVPKRGKASWLMEGASRLNVSWLEQASTSSTSLKHYDLSFVLVSATTSLRASAKVHLRYAEEVEVGAFLAASNQHAFDRKAHLPPSRSSRRQLLLVLAA